MCVCVGCVCVLVLKNMDSLSVNPAGGTDMSFCVLLSQSDVRVNAADMLV